MTHPLGLLRLIVNPHAGRGRVRQNLPALRRALDQHGLDHDVVETTGPGDATEAARKALAEGVLYLVAVGGDGTVNEVCNGMFEDGHPIAEKAILGVAAVGSGSDFARTFGLNLKPERLAKHFADDRILRVDLGRVRYHTLNGEPVARLFANIAQVGYGAEVVRLADRLPRVVGKFRYLLAAWASIRKMQRPEATVRLSFTEQRRPLVELVVANGQFFGGGMQVAPRALPDDGKYNVQLFYGQRSQVFLLTQKLYHGDHLPHPQISEYQSPTVEVEAATPLPVESDGEFLGRTPASFDLLHRMLRLKI